MIVFSKRHIISLLICVIAVVFFGYSISSTSVFKSGQRNLPIYSVDNNEAISLTFNCAWGDEDIDSILETLNKFDVKATFFVVGQWAEKYPQSLKKIISAGHEIGGHSYDHKDYTKLGEKELREDIKKNKNAIYDAALYEIKLIRVPSGAYNNLSISTIEDMGFIPVQWSVDSIDYGDADCEGIFQRATHNTKAGDIVLMHTGTKNTAQALPRILDSLSGKFKILKVSELIFQENFFVDNTGKMISNKPNNSAK